MSLGKLSQQELRFLNEYRLLKQDDKQRISEQMSQLLQRCERENPDYYIDLMIADGEDPDAVQRALRDDRSSRE